MSAYRVLTWHVHGAYLYYLSLTGHELIVPTKPGRPESYGGRSGAYPWPANIVEVPFEEVRTMRFDCVLAQSRKNWEEDRFECLSEEQLRLPQLYLEHDPPCEHPTNTRHRVDDPNVVLVHVTPFNALMWDSGRSTVRVVEHGVRIPEGVRFSGDIPAGVTAINELHRRGRRLGADIFARVREHVPVELVGMGAEAFGGIGEVPHRELAAFMARHRFFFSPIRYTSLGLAIIEAMLAGMPVVGLATAELATVIRNGESGYIETDPDALLAPMRELLACPGLAAELGERARRDAAERFSIGRFTRDWTNVFAEATGRAARVSFATAGAGRSGA